MAAQLVQVQQQACSSITIFNGHFLSSSSTSKSSYTISATARCHISDQTTLALPLPLPLINKMMNNKQRSRSRSCSLGRRRPPPQQRIIFLQLHYSSTTTTISSSSSSSSDDDESSRGGIPLLISENGWKVRRMVESDEEMRMVARVQAEAFYEPLVFFNDLFFQSFKAEVLSGLLYRLRNSPPNRYACLVAEHNTNIKGIQQQLVGFVDITVQRDNDTLQYLHQAQEYLYISGIAVSTQFRRQKVATALLRACEKLSTQWGFDYLALRAYQDDTGACTLYKNAGFIVAAKDSEWMTTWIGRRRRLLFIKKIHSIQQLSPLRYDNEHN